VTENTFLKLRKHFCISHSRNKSKHGEISGSHGAEYGGTFFWVVAPCGLVEVYRRLRRVCCLHHQGDGIPKHSTLQVETLWFFVGIILFSVLECRLRGVTSETKSYKDFSYFHRKPDFYLLVFFNYT
jgi:hypothetical protein